MHINRVVGLWSRDLYQSNLGILGEDRGESDLAFRDFSMPSHMLTTCEVQNADDGA